MHDANLDHPGRRAGPRSQQAHDLAHRLPLGRRAACPGTAGGLSDRRPAARRFLHREQAVHVGAGERNPETGHWVDRRLDHARALGRLRQPGHDWASASNAGRSKVIGGLYGSPGGGTSSINSCYLSPIETVPLDRTTRFDYDYSLAVGTVDQIRQQFYEARQSAASPPAGFPSRRGQVWAFDSNGDFGGWRPTAKIAASSVTSGRLEADATSGDPYAYSPPTR